MTVYQVRWRSRALGASFANHTNERQAEDHFARCVASLDYEAAQLVRMIDDFPAVIIASWDRQGVCKAVTLGAFERGENLPRAA